MEFFFYLFIISFFMYSAQQPKKDSWRSQYGETLNICIKLDNIRVGVEWIIYSVLHPTLSGSIKILMKTCHYYQIEEAP